MALTNAGRDMMAQRLIGVGTAFDNTNAYIGVGSSDAAEDASYTDLQGTKKRVGMDLTFPVSGPTDNVLTFRSTFASADANFAWNEWGVFNAAAAGTMLNRKVEYNGTKVSGQTWVFEVELTISIGT